MARVPAGRRSRTRAGTETRVLAVRPPVTVMRSARPGSQKGDRLLSPSSVRASVRWSGRFPSGARRHREVVPSYRKAPAGNPAGGCLLRDVSASPDGDATFQSFGLRVVAGSEAADR